MENVMFKKMPLILLALMILLAGAYPLLSLNCKSLLYGMSLSLKSLIIFILPFLIFSLMFKTVVQLAKNASRWILFILSAICISNFISTMLSFFVGGCAYCCDLSIVLPAEGRVLLPLGELTLPQWFGNGKAMLAGVLSGVICGKLMPNFTEKANCYLEKGIALVLKGLLCVLPLFIGGFLVKMIHEEMLGLILYQYALVFAIVAGAVFSYIVLIYLIGSGFHAKTFMSNIKNMFPAALVGFSSMSSAAALPLSILGVEKNGKNCGIARAIIPAAVNIHLIGDCFAIPIFAFAILKSFGMEEPSFSTYLPFAFSFVLAKFSVAAVPGGGILVMLPILETYLGLDGQMLSLITALYILFDPLITSANVFGNGGFAMGLERFFSKKKAETSF
jgi:hypothetical protein